MTERAERELEWDGRRYRVVEAWRASTGWALGYALLLEEGAPASQDREDRRFPLAPDERLGDLDPDALRERLGEAAGITVTERRFADRDVRPWLAQNIGPVWAAGEIAAGLTGVLFTALAGPERRVRAPGGHVAPMSDEELRDHLSRGLAPEDDPGESGD